MKHEIEFESRAFQMNRRIFLRTATMAGFATCVSRLRDPAIDHRISAIREDKRSFRTITYNILACRGYPERRENKQRLKRARMRMAERFALELAVYNPDVVTFQESPPENTVAQIAEHLGMKFTFFPGGFPGAVLTRHEIKNSANCPAPAGKRHAADLFSRHWGRATLEVNASELIVYSAHLHPGDDALRLRECEAMLAAMSGDLASGKNVILQGDLNDEPGSPMYERLRNVGLQDAFAAKGTGKGLTCSSNNLRWRIDYVCSKGPMSRCISECRVLAEGPFIDHANDPAGFALSDHLPVMATFSDLGEG